MRESYEETTARPFELFGHRIFWADVWGLVGTLALFGPGFLHRVLLSFSPYTANDDSQQVTWSLFRYGDPLLFARDPIADYYLDTHLPFGYHVLMRGLASIADPVLLCAAFDHICALVAMAFALLTGRFLAGRIGGWLSVALLLASDQLLEITGGGLPRSAGVAIIFIALYGFLCDRRTYTAVASVLGALFWYPAAVSSGALFAVQCLAPGALLFDRQVKEPVLKRILLIAAVAALTAVCAAPKILAQSRWGPVVTNVSSAWPEAGPGGRLAHRDQLGFINPIDIIPNTVRRTFVSAHSPWWGNDQSLQWLKGKVAAAIWMVLLAGLVVSSWACLAARRLLAVMAVSISLSFVAALIAPILYAAPRYTAYIIPWASILAFTYLSGRIGSWLSTRLSWASPATVQVLAAAIIIFGLGGRPLSQGYNVSLAPVERQAIDFISQLPKSVLIAGWPDPGGLPDRIPLFAKRSVLLSFEVHLPFHEQQLIRMRARANAIIDAWFAVDDRPLRSLAERYGVTHLIIDKARRADASLTYFKPFDAYIDLRRKDLGSKRRWIETPPAAATVFENERFAVVDLGTLGQP
jgi:hypothetical protein